MQGFTEWANVITDIIHHTIKGYLLVSLITKLIPFKAKFVKYQKWVFWGVILQYMVFYLLLSYWKAFRILLYNSPNAPATSRMSNIPLLISITLMSICCLFFFGGKRSSLLYLIVSFYAVSELIMFMIHFVFMVILEGIVAIETYFVMAGNEWVFRHFEVILSIIQYLWMLSYQIVFILLLFVCIRQMKRNLSYENREFTTLQQIFLAIPSIMGLCFGIMMRSIFYESIDVRMEFLMDNFPETNFLIPFISGLCLASIVLSTLILKKLIESNEKEILVEIYQNRINDMEEHMKDVEHLYDGIRGMRHDMKNYVADLEVMLRNGNRENNTDYYQDEVKKYLDGLSDAMEELEMKCNTGNPVTDIVISRKMRAAREKEISFSCDFIYFPQMDISAFDVSIILNNGLDNAMEAAEKEKKPYISLDSYIRGNMFFIEIRNSFTGELNFDEAGKTLQTCKKETGHGLGLKNIRNCANKYYGKVDWMVQDGEFILTVMLQMGR